MPPKFVVAPLALDKIPLAYPLVRSLSAQVSADRWQSFAGALTAGGGTRGGVFAAEEHFGGYLYGVCTYVVEEDLLHGLTLKVEHFVTLDFISRTSAAQSLIEGLENLARRLRCNALHVTLHAAPGTDLLGGGAVLRLFEERGHDVDAVRTSKTMGPMVQP